VLTYGGALEDAALTGDLDITDEVSIVGAGAKDVTIDGNASDRLFHVVAGVAVSISGVTMANGKGIGQGGAIYLNNSSASLTLERVRITGNLCDDAGGGSAGGGAISTTTGAGVAIYDSTIDNNHVTAVSSAIGGGLNLNGGLAVITLANVTISGNTLSAASFAAGSGIAFNSSHPSLNNVTIVGNTGGVGISKSSGAAPTLRNTIVALNSPSDCSGSIVSAGYTLFGTTSGCTITSGPGDIVNPAPLLGNLTYNGGDTPTHALLAGSPAIATGSPDTPGSMTATACEALDQRGGPRAVPIGTRCDIGAYETGCGNLLPDPSEICDGSACCTAACGVAANLTPCPDDGNECTNDQCNGVSSLCQHPAKSNGTPCTDDGEFCTNDQCGGGTCTHTPKGNGTLCPDELNDCTNDVCTAGVCTHPAKPDGTLCADEPNECTADSCAGGSCQHDPQPGQPCNDGDACTSGDTCSAVGLCDPGAGCAPCTVCAGPILGCTTGPSLACVTPPEKKSTFSVKLGVTPAEAKFKWKWTKGPNVTAGDLGNPATGSTGYTLCVFDQDGGALAFQSDVAAGGTCGTTSCWRPAKTGYKFFDKNAAQDGVRGLQAYAGDLGKAKFVVSGKGAAMPLTNLPYTPKVIVELHRTDAPLCWSGEFESHVLATSDVFFKALSDP
jgi:hypothetical protein